MAANSRTPSQRKSVALERLISRKKKPCGFIAHGFVEISDFEG
jgi:hypothetical protein